DLLGFGRRGNHRETAILLGDQSQNVALDAVIERDDVEARHALRIDALTLRENAPLIPLVGLLRRDELGQVHALQARKLPGSFDGFFGFGLRARDDAAGLRALVAQDPSQLARVDLSDRDGLAAAQELLETALGPPVADGRREVANDEPGRVSLR